MLRIRCVRFNLLAELRYVLIQCSRRTPVLDAPDLIEYKRAVNDFAIVVREKLHQVDFT